MGKPRLRSSQLINGYGPGSMVDLPDDAVMIAALDAWRYNTEQPIPTVAEPRLVGGSSRLLGRTGITPCAGRRPPSRKRASPRTLAPITFQSGLFLSGRLSRHEGIVLGGWSIARTWRRGSCWRTTARNTPWCRYASFEPACKATLATSTGGHSFTARKIPVTASCFSKSEERPGTSRPFGFAVPADWNEP